MRAGLLLLLAACRPQALDGEELRDPRACQECHPDHYREWSGSMHAYAAEDPVFLAMERRGQEETAGALGDFCVNCHAPGAVLLGQVTDGSDLDDADPELLGVTCWYCHQVTDVEGTHNNPLVIAQDRVLRGGISDPIRPRAHVAEYSPLHDRLERESSELCGSCHDIVVPGGAHIERTFAEWQESLYGTSFTFGLTCGQCHMRGRDGPAARVDGAPVRRVHDHAFPGVDLALTPFPGIDEQRERVQSLLDTSVLAQLCVREDQGESEIIVDLENIAAGHSWPSGASADRRAWVELEAWDDDVQLHSSGVVADGEAVTELAEPPLVLLRDTLLDDSGAETHDFWEAASFTSDVLPAPTSRDPLDPGYVETHRQWSVLVPGVPTRVQMRLRLRPIGLDVLDDLIASGHLDRDIRDAMVTFDLAYTDLVWTPDTAKPSTAGVTCVP